MKKFENCISWFLLYKQLNYYSVENSVYFLICACVDKCERYIP